MTPSLIERLRALAQLWRRQQAEYPQTPVGQHAAAAVRCCANELAALLAEATPAQPPLTFAELSAVNLQRVQRWHPEKGIADWSPLEWAGAMAGEAGEACNAAKKLKRIDIGTKNINLEPGRSLTDRQLACKQVAKEVADTVIYGSLLVAAVGEDFGATIVEVFNQKSEEYGFPERLAEATPAPLMSNSPIT
jgi:NTP pyrophosphatase (non-canonical NTP hydrolase)